MSWVASTWCATQPVSREALEAARVMQRLVDLAGRERNVPEPPERAREQRVVAAALRVRMNLEPQVLGALDRAGQVRQHRGERELEAQHVDRRDRSGGQRLERGQRLCGAPAAFLDLRVLQQRDHQRGGQLDAELRVAVGREGPIDGAARIGQRLPHAGGVVHAGEAGGGRVAAEQRGEVARVACGERLRLAGRVQLFERVGARGLGQAVACHRAVELHADERLRHQFADPVHHGAHRQLAVAGHGAHRFQRERAAERREPPQQRAALAIEQREAPVERGAQRLVARQRGAKTARQQREPVGQPLVDAVDAEADDARGGQLDRERNAVEAAADLADQPQFGRAAALFMEAAAHRLHAREEQLHGGALQDGRLVGVALRHVERLDGEHRLGGDAQRLAARHQDAQRRHGGEQAFHDARDLDDHVLGVVEQQQPRRAGRRQQRAACGGGVRQPQADAGLDGRDDLGRALHRGQLDQMHAAGHTGLDRARHGHRQGGLADAAGAVSVSTRVWPSASRTAATAWVRPITSGCRGRRAAGCAPRGGSAAVRRTSR
ncbi:hypothetical protein [Burkholderia glumae]|uniref:hypothetical protein n=1 Tax=Burkholderia glumae TaxID=337 RepID=UPI003B9CA2AC